MTDEEWVKVKDIPVFIPVIYAIFASVDIFIAMVTPVWQVGFCSAMFLLGAGTVLMFKWRGYKIERRDKVALRQVDDTL